MIKTSIFNVDYSEPKPNNLSQIYVGMGCFWGAERKFWSVDGVYSTAVGYAGGFTPNPSYEEVCSGQTGHTEAVFLVYDPVKMALDKILCPKAISDNESPLCQNSIVSSFASRPFLRPHTISPNSA